MSVSTIRLAEPRLLRCPKCAEAFLQGPALCPACGETVDLERALEDADRRETFAAAFAEAHSARTSAGLLISFFAAGFIPIIGIVATVGVPVLVVWILIELVQWYKRYGRLRSADPDFVTARACASQAAWMWTFSFLVAPFWLALRLGLAR